MRFDRVREFKGKCKGQRLALLGNGPSLDAIDVKALKCPTIGMNRSWRKVFSPYHIIIDTLFLEELAYPQNRWNPLQEGVTVFTSINSAYLYSRQTMLLDAFVKIKSTLPEKDKPRFSLDLENNGIVNIQTGISALQLAVWMEPKEIWLLGYDHKSGEGHFGTELDNQVNYPWINVLHQNFEYYYPFWKEIADFLSVAKPEIRIYRTFQSALDMFEVGNPEVLYE